VFHEYTYGAVPTVIVKSIEPVAFPWQSTFTWLEVAEIELIVTFNVTIESHPLTENKLTVKLPGPLID
jgi:hypothetical protein